MSVVKCRDINFSIKMLAQRFFTCFTFLVLCNSNTIYWCAMAADNVQQLNLILGHPGWPDFKPLKVLDEEISKGVDVLLTSDPGEQNLVTDRNVWEKAWLAHKLLNCDYALMFLTYTEYMYRIGRHCDEMTHLDGKQECLKKFKRLSDEELLVLRMKSAIAYVNSLSPSKILISDFYNILTRFGDAYKMTPDPESSDTPNPQYKVITTKRSMLCFTSTEKKVEIIPETIKNTLNLIDHLRNQTRYFFENHCAPKSHLSKSNNIESSTYSWFLVLTDEQLKDDSSAIVSVNKMFAIVNNIINGFIVSDYTRLGFRFNPRSNTTVLNENVDTENRVYQTNEILIHEGWSKHLSKYTVVMDGRQYSVIDLLATQVKGQIVNGVNVDTKMRQAYGFLSCYYAEFLKVLLPYQRSLAQLFYNIYPGNQFEFFRSFVKIVKKSDPVILRMRGTLFYFQQLSPQTGFKNYILKIISFFMNSIEYINITINNQRDLGRVLCDRMKTFQSNLSEVEKELNKYTDKYCVVQSGTHKNNEVPQSSQNEIERQIDTKINNFIDTAFPYLGLNTTHFKALSLD